MPDDQDAARRLVLEGLREHFGFLDETRNPDLDDIASSYAGQVFLLAEEQGRIVGTGALVRVTKHVGQIGRMSVDRQHRRTGIGRMILARLLEHASASGYRWIVLETNQAWADANAFYRAGGFTEIGRGFGGVAFALDLQAEDGRPSSLRSRWLLLKLLWRHVRPRPGRRLRR